MSDGDKWGKLSELKDLTDQLKNNNKIVMILLAKL